jgi:hypothetical protein
MQVKSRLLAPLALCLCALSLPSAASATATSKQIKAAQAAAVSYFESIQNADGSFPGFDNDWTLGALAAARVAPADVAQSGGTDARSFYRGLFGDPSSWPGGTEPSVTEFERAALNSYAAGVDPARVSVRQNLIARIVGRYQPSAPGYYGGPTNWGGSLFGLLALAEARTRGGAPRVPAALLAPSIAVVRANQHTDGGWTFERSEGNPTKLGQPSEPDETGAAMAALCSAGVPSSDPAIAHAVQYLQADQLAGSGAFDAAFGANADSDAWAVQGLNACGIDPQGSAFTTSSGRTPIDFLLSLQAASGGFSFEAGETAANEYSSQDALRAISGGTFTAKPAGARSGPKWVGAGSFEAGVQSQVALVIDDGSSPVRACAVPLTPSAATTTLATVLEAAASAGTPASCVTGLQPGTGKGALTQVNGSPATPEARWFVAVDGGREKLAKRTSKIGLGATISLRLH